MWENWMADHGTVFSLNAALPQHAQRVKFLWNLSQQVSGFWIIY